ncbi:MAG: gliding motility-associated C-terminal domain-containing protein [Saprospiraceae bacterium]|nr:gliding motility-associated C-terminal domain-containing protein [Saprospiraceae bacterium]MDC3253749.1 gliding motility-associated C-terminal domain-containing protein [bacterium]MDG1434705.1 gliding motility-associated C-terminal domain-containing protein [Saprospiraceae bacterium]MDG2418655.1 gliding motility-associated C-terminal domain-containing protein [Saprospiraceae bacterium]
MSKLRIKGYWNMIIRVATLVIFLIFSNKTIAQVFPPGFLCVRSDTLFWDIPTNNCGIFNNYEILFSANSTGPFNLLGTISNQGQDFFHHPNPTANTWYYYLQSDFNCPGEIVLQSDTLDNQQPSVAILTGASVNGNSIELEWIASPSPEVSAYIVFRSTSMGAIALDTIYGGVTNFADDTASPNEQSETYFILAIDECGNTSIFNDAHSTVFLEQSVISCEQKIVLNWNLYQGWTNGVGSQEVWANINGGGAFLQATISGSDTSYVFENASNSDNYCFYIKSIENGTDVEVLSNKTCVVPDIIEPMRDLILRNVKVLPDNSVELIWDWNSIAEIQSFEILQSLESDPVSTFTILNSTPAPIPLGNGKTYIDVISEPSESKVFYKIQTTDDCDTVVESNYGSTIHLVGNPQPGFTNFLTWTSFDIENAELVDYAIYRIVNDVSTFVELVPAGTTFFSDEVDPSESSESNVCYFVVAKANLTLPNGSIESIESSSNTTCVEQLVSIVAPNAFAPQGVNQIFRPLIIFGETVNYHFSVYNRWGELLFETKDIDEGWNGKYKGVIQPLGAYIFQVRITQVNGRVVEDSGVFTLLR